MPDAAIYKLEPIVDDPRFEGFAFVRHESIRGKVIGGCSRLTWDFGSDDKKTKGRAWTVPSLTPFWTPKHVVGRVRAFNDYPCVNLIIPLSAVAPLMRFAISWSPTVNFSRLSLPWGNTTRTIQEPWRTLSTSKGRRYNG